MANVTAFAKLKTTAARFVQPDIRNYNRLEVSPRSKNYQQSLAMETHDPMWFLCRQWQFGEFEGEDAATAAEARVLGRHARAGEIVLRGARQPYDELLPLEAVVEQEAIQPTLSLRLQAGRYFAKLLAQKRLKRYVSVFANEVPLNASIPDDDDEGLYFAMALSSGIPDGYDILQRIEDNTYAALYDSRPDVASADHPELAKAGEEFADWFSTFYVQPAGSDSAWDSSCLEYNFSLAARLDNIGVRELTADQYTGGRLDWKDFDQVQKPRQRRVDNLSPVTAEVQTFLPTQLKFSGMPHPRLWQLEDGEVNFGELDGSPTSLLNVLAARFGLNYSNDWFVLPYELPVNTVCEIQGILVKDVFGEYLWVRPAIEDLETNWHRFAMFHQTERDNATFGKSVFYLAPAVGGRLESEDVERVNLIRDEMSNMVWAIEQIVESQVGTGRHVKRNTPSLEEFKPSDNVARIRYVLGNTVPDNWIPFLPVHKPVPAGGIPREIRLQRARMPQASGASSRLLTEVQPVYFIEEGEVPRSGTIVTRRYHRTRWLNGRIVLWMGRRKMAGYGEGAANFQFDSIRDIPENQ
jgi:hypothetical protein